MKMTIRKSNIEFARIVAMFLIVTSHVFVHGLNETMSEQYGNLRTFAYYGVNVFVMISGYCGIHPTWSKGVQLYLKCAIYALLCYLVHWQLDGARFGTEFFHQVAFPFSYNDLWFVPCYFCLFLLSPLLNKAIEHLSRRELLYICIAWMVVLSYFVWHRHFDYISFGTGGLNHFLWLYCLGALLRKCHNPKQITNKEKIIKPIGVWKSLLGYILCSLSSFVLAQYNIIYVYANCNPLVVIGAICLIELCLSINFQSKIVNFIASTMFAVYLIHENLYLRAPIRAWVNEFVTTPYLIPVASLVILIACVSIDSVVGIATKPLLKGSDVLVNRISNRLAQQIKSPKTLTTNNEFINKN